MSQSKYPKLSVRNRPGSEGQITVGANTLVELNGQPLGNVSFIKIEIGAKRVAKVMMEMFVELDIEVNLSHLDVMKETDTGYVLKNKPLAVRTMGNYSPRGIAIKK
jgi:hypothetical protein